MVWKNDVLKKAAMLEFSIGSLAIKKKKIRPFLLS